MSGSDLLNFFKAMDSPGLPPGMRGEELDWVWEHSKGSRHFLEWLLSHVRPETHLLSSEEAEYEKNGGMARYSSGREEEDDDEDVSEEEIHRLEEELFSLTEAQGEISSVTASYDDLTLSLSNKATILRYKNERHQESTDIPVNEATKEYLSQRDYLQKEISNIREHLCESIMNKSILVSELSLQDLQKESKTFEELLDEFIDKQFHVGIDAKELEEAICYDLVVGRSEGEFDALVGEISRLKLGYITQERLRSFASARVFGEEKALQFLSSHMENYFSPETENSFVRSAQQFYDKIKNQTEVDISNASERVLGPLLDEIAGYHCRQILNLDCQTKLYRQKYTLDRHVVLRDILTEQFSLQEMFLVVLSNEWTGFKSIGKELTIIEAHHGDLQSHILEIRDTTMKVKDKLLGLKNTTELSHKSDAVLSAIGSILGLREKDFSYESLLPSMKELVSSTQQRETDCMRSSEENSRLIGQSVQLLKHLHKNLGANYSGSALSLLDEEYASLTLKLRVKMKELESSFSRFDKDLEKSKSALKEDPQSSVQKKIWVNFLNNPKLMEININALINKIKSM